MMVLNGEEELECEIHVDGIRLEHVSEFKYLGCILDESGTDGAECSRKLTSGMRVADPIRSLVNARDLQLQCPIVLHDTGSPGGLVARACGMSQVRLPAGMDANLSFFLFQIALLKIQYIFYILFSLILLLLSPPPFVSYLFLTPLFSLYLSLTPYHPTAPHFSRS